MSQVSPLYSTSHKGEPSANDIAFLKEQAKTVRIEILKMLAEAGSGRTGSSLSAADVATD